MIFPYISIFILLYGFLIVSAKRDSELFFAISFLQFPIIQEKLNLENKCITLEKDFHNKEIELKRNFNKKYDELLSENIYLNKIINTFQKTIKKFIS